MVFGMVGEELIHSKEVIIMLTVMVASGKHRNDFDHYIVYGSMKWKFLIFDRGWIWINHIDYCPNKTIKEKVR